MYSVQTKMFNSVEVISVGNSGAGHANPLASVKVSAEGVEVTVDSFAQADRIMANKNKHNR